MALRFEHSNARKLALALAVASAAACVTHKDTRDVRYLDLGRPHRVPGQAERPRVRLVGPAPNAWSPTPSKVPQPKVSAAELERFPLIAVANEHDAPVYRAPNLRNGRGLLRRGAHTRAQRTSARAHCRGGNWYELMFGGYICNTRGFDVLDHPPQRRSGATRTRDLPLPYRYAKAADGALRFSRPPSATEFAQIEASDDAREHPVVVDRMEGIYFLALSGDAETRDGITYVRTVQGHYVQADLMEPRKLPKMHGEPVVAAQPLPIAFVYGPDEPATLYWAEDGALYEAGEAHRHARLSVRTQREFDTRDYWVASDGLAIAADRVRVATRRQPPSGVGDDERWIHVDLSEQTLVAYVGRTPVYATLVSSGKEGYDTPTGEFRVLHKYISTTMRGPDPDAGHYYIEEVPWTQYYDGSFALHGAFWHNEFGKVRSHGCTNLAPVDARWLYYFTQPRVPPGWHGVRAQGTRIVITE